MLQWFISFPEFAEFTEILFYLGKTQSSSEAVGSRGGIIFEKNPRQS